MATSKQIQDALDLLEKEGYRAKKITPLLSGDILTHDRTGLKLVIDFVNQDGTFLGHIYAAV